MANYSERQNNPLITMDSGGRLSRGGYWWISNKQINIGYHPPSGSGGSGDGFRFNVTITGKESLIRAFDGLKLVQNYLDSNEMMTPAVRAFGIEWRRNYAVEGRLYKEWAPLSAATMEKRRERGYDDAHPILKQSGSLWAGAIVPMFDWSVSRGNFTRIVNPSSNDGTSGGAIVTYAVSGRHFRAAITGPKAEHMGGKYFVSSNIPSPNSRPRYVGGLLVGHMPSRPFWYVTSALEQKSADLTKKFMVGRINYYLGSGRGGNTYYAPTVRSYAKMTG